MSISPPTPAFSESNEAPAPFTLVALADRFGDIPAIRICMNPPPGQATEDDLLFYAARDRLYELIDGILLEKDIGDYESPVSLVQLADRFGDIPANRICMSPPPGLATERDVLRFQEGGDRQFELVHGTLLEKTMGTYESYVAGRILQALLTYLDQQPLGVAIPGDGPLKISDDTIRIPDVSLIKFDRLPEGGFPDEQRITAVAPNLAVEVINPSNSRKEMDDKLVDYFHSGSEEVWYIYPKGRELHQFTNPTAAPRVWRGSADVVTDLLPGFTLNLAKIFSMPGRQVK